MKNKAYHVEEKFEKKPDPNWLNNRIVFSHPSFPLKIIRFRLWWNVEHFWANVDNVDNVDSFGINVVCPICPH